MIERHGDFAELGEILRARQLEPVQIGEIRKALTILENIASGPTAPTRTKPSPAYHRSMSVEAAARDQAARRRRRDLFGDLDIKDAGWEILVELYVMSAKGIRLGVTDIGRETETPQATVIRWLALLEHHHLVSRAADTLDRRRCWVTLTRQAEVRMEHYFTAIAGGESMHHA
jgi:DNA-binding MarR family transcriptional regulator